MARRVICMAGVLVALLVAGCGAGESDLTITVDTRAPGEEGPGKPAGPGSKADRAGVPGGADAEDVRVIGEWSEALSEGDIKAAAGYFAIPSVAENGPVLLRIRNQGQAKLFNSALPCGAKLIRAVTEGAFTTATFRLTERPGEGFCGIGDEQATAETSFVIEGGKIAEWRRVDTAVPDPPPGDVV